MFGLWIVAGDVRIVNGNASPFQQKTRADTSEWDSLTFLQPPRPCPRVDTMKPSKAKSKASSPSLLEGLANHHAGGKLPSEILRELEKKLNGHPVLGAEMQSLWEMLDLVLKKSARNPGAGRPDLKLLNLACGPCREADLLSAFWAQQSTTVRHFAMDLRGPQIEKAERRHEAVEKLFQEAGVPQIRPRDESSTIEFFADDATRLVGYGEIPSEYDVVFIRHQNFYHDPAVWRRIFEFALHSTAEDGLLVITSYFDREHLLALNLLRKVGGVVLASERNPTSKPLPNVSGMSVDRHVAAIAKRTASEFTLEDAI